MTRSEIDMLGEKLKRTPVNEETLRALDAYRLTFDSAITQVVDVLRDQAKVTCSQRPSKSTLSIVAKLIRQPTTRLSQIQDIAGLRVIVKDFAEQDMLRDIVLALFTHSNPKIYDRRENPSAGYRAVHVVVEIDKRLVEIQIRTELQHLWGQFSELLSNLVGGKLKYGEGDPHLLAYLELLSNLITDFERRAQMAKKDALGHYVGSFEPMRLFVLERPALIAMLNVNLSVTENLKKKIAQP